MANDVKKESEREEIHRSVWAIADELRGAVDGWDFKNYVLGTMFYRYISENFTDYINQNEIDAGNTDFDYAKMFDSQIEDEFREELINTKGFFIYPSELFKNLCARAKTDENLNMTLEKIFKNIEESSQENPAFADKFKGLFADFDVNSNKLGGSVAKRNERIVKLLNGVKDMKLGAVNDHSGDSIGDAYEYLMSMYASNAGKSGGEFFTPADVSELLTRLGTVGKDQIRKVYDPACGSGSLLLKSQKILGDNSDLQFLGQEINVTTYNLCRINMFIHGIEPDHFDIKCEDTLTHPQHERNLKFDLIVSNPPYSIKWKGEDDQILINDPRYTPAGILAPKSKADMAFIMHSLSYLDTDGAAAIVCFPGIMYRGGAEQKIRRYLVDNNYIDAIVQLPANLFFGTSIATCVMVLKKSKSNNDVVFIDASNEFVKVTNNNRLTPSNIDNIVNAYSNRENHEYFCKVVSHNEIAEQNYNLSVSTYVEQEDKREKIDIKKLNAEIKSIVEREQILRDDIDKIIAELSGVNE